jgi:hypothetical protein
MITSQRAAGVPPAEPSEKSAAANMFDAAKSQFFRQDAGSTL